MIETRRDGHVLTLELQREERRNALNTELCNSIKTALEQAVSDGVRAVVVTGRGTSFCAGADLSGDAFVAHFPDALNSMLRTVQSVPIPVIAAIHGPAVGAGTQLAIACDLRVVGPGGFFEIPSTKLAIAVNNWTIKRLTSVAGGGVARTILMGGERVHPEQAFMSGLANKLGGIDTALEWAHEIAGRAPLALKHLKLVFNDDGTSEPENDAQAEAFKAAWASADAQEARAARSEKRTPTFEGR